MTTDKMRAEFEAWAEDNDCGITLAATTATGFYTRNIAWTAYQAAYAAGRKAEQAEVERLRAELAACQSLVDETRTELSICGAFHSVAKKEWQLEVEKVNRLEAELAAAKAASVVPVKVVDCFADIDRTAVVILWSNADAERFADWLRERIGEKGDGELSRIT